MSVLDVVDEKLTLVPINRDEPAIRLLRMRYLERYALPQENVSNATRWFGVKRGPRGAVVAVIGERYDAAHNASEITDFYVQPSRDGALAMRAVIKFYKQLFESKKRTTIVFATLIRNRSINQRVQKILSPRAYVYVATHDPKLMGV